MFARMLTDAWTRRPADRQKPRRNGVFHRGGALPMVGNSYIVSRVFLATF